MKIISVISFVFFLSFRPLVPVVEYMLNYDQIIREFCINREKREMMCDGKCYFFDELAKTSNADSSHGISNQTMKMQEIYINAEAFKVVLIDFDKPEKYQSIKYPEDLYRFTFCQSVFHPPVFVS